MSVQDRDNGYQDLVRRVFGFGRPKITVGVQAAEGAEKHGKNLLIKDSTGKIRDTSGKFVNAARKAKLERMQKKAEESNTTILDVAIWNEFGAGNIPERSFIRAWFEQAGPKAKEEIARLLVQVIAGKITKEQALEKLGQKFQGEIQQRMAQGIPPPNATSTIKQKGSSKPLINTGQLRSSIRYKVIP